jgi:polyisoprenoid-binding protein YceI
VLGTSPLNATPWTLDPERSRVHVSLRHFGVASIKGEFTKMTGHVRADSTHALRELVLHVDASSLDTKLSTRDTHMRQLQIFGNDEHPTLEFKSTWSYEKGRGREGMQGSLRMHGQTHIIELIASEPKLETDEHGRTWYVAHVTGVLDRRRWGVAVHPLLEIGGVLLGHEVHIELRLHAPVEAVHG